MTFIVIGHLRPEDRVNLVQQQRRPPLMNGSVEDRFRGDGRSPRFGHDQLKNFKEPCFAASRIRACVGEIRRLVKYLDEMCVDGPDSDHE